jgi:hypothetical protein
MPIDPFAVLHALVRAEAARAADTGAADRSDTARTPASPGPVSPGGAPAPDPAPPGRDAATAVTATARDTVRELRPATSGTRARLQGDAPGAA